MFRRSCSLRKFLTASGCGQLEPALTKLMKPIVCIVTFVLATGLPGISEETVPDNTAINQRDKSGENPTPIDQSNRAPDLKLTQAIRRAIVKDPSLSAMAKNVKIITFDGQVVLRGPVKTDAEKASIARTASDAAGAAKVENQLEVKGNRSPDRR